MHVSCAECVRVCVCVCIVSALYQAWACLLSEQGRSEAARAALKESMAHWWDPEDSDDEDPQQHETHTEAAGAMQEDMQTDAQVRHAAHAACDPEH
jgi:hypothetical protein